MTLDWQCSWNLLALLISARLFRVPHQLFLAGFVTWGFNWDTANLAIFYMDSCSSLGRLTRCPKRITLEVKAKPLRPVVKMVLKSEEWELSLKGKTTQLHFRGVSSWRTHLYPQSLREEPSGSFCVRPSHLTHPCHGMDPAFPIESGLEEQQPELFRGLLMLG